MITELQRTLNGIYSSANSTLLFNAPPYLPVNSEVILYFTSNDSKYSAIVTSTSGNTAVINFTNSQYANNSVSVMTNYYGSGITGAQEPFSFKMSTPPNSLVQVTTNGTSANIKLEVTNDQRAWISLGNLGPSLANSNTAYINVTAPWQYGRLNITDIGANGSLTAVKAI